jgi:adenosylcobyric acid synthase
MTVARGRVIMLQGTASHAGKTVLAAALCRIYARRGLGVAPFKAQNLALNSFVTEGGGEMGRAQVYQARAAGLEPQVDMNPVLLKPSSDATSQVVVMGSPVGHMTVREYHAYQTRVWPTVTAAFERLRTTHDLVVLEGAGSSAEVNLRGRDIVNMRMALHARSPVLLVGDIDRGGVFASLLGHVELFTPEERGLVAGFVINKMRGEASQLDSGIEILSGRTGVPTLGVVPMLEQWSGDEEDSVALDGGYRAEKEDAPLRIVVVRLPYLSNSTDTDALAAEPDVDVRFVSSPDELAGAAAVVLPGTKSTIADLAWLRERGLDDAVKEAAAAGTPVVGICGGYQMLGRRIIDPEHVESAARAVDGLGLLDAETTFAAGKRTVRTQGELIGRPAGPRAGEPVSSAGPLGPPGTPVRGYEIHMGRTGLGPGAAPLLRLRGAGESEHLDGAVSGAVCGTYVHGLFDHADLRAAFLNSLRAARGLPPRPASVPHGDGIDRLADHVEAHLDLAALDAIIWA